MVKCIQPPVIKYIPFDHLEFRIYKGEGTVQFVAYYPFAFGVVSPSLAYSAAGATVNNSGDMPANLDILFDLTSSNGDITLKLGDTAGAQNFGVLSLVDVDAQGDDKYMEINTRTQLIEGLDENKNKTGNLYNKFIDAGDFFWPPIGRSVLTSNKPFISAQYTPMYY